MIVLFCIVLRCIVGAAELHSALLKPFCSAATHGRRQPDGQAAHLSSDPVQLAAPADALARVLPGSGGACTRRWLPNGDRQQTGQPAVGLAVGLQPLRQLIACSTAVQQGALDEV